MDQALAARRNEFNDAVRIFGIDERAAESLWDYASRVGMNIDDFTLSILLYGARQEKSARDAEARIGEKIHDFQGNLDARLETIIDAATLEIEANNSKLVADLQGKISEAVSKATGAAVEKVGESRVSEVRSHVCRANATAATACAFMVILAAIFSGAYGYVNGRDNAVIVAQEMAAVAKRPDAGKWLIVAGVNDPSVLNEYCGRGSGNLKQIEGRLQCTLPIWISGEKAMKNVGSFGEAVSALSLWISEFKTWVIVLIGAIGGLALRKALRNFAMISPVRWLLDIDKKATF